jgi:hypothetical protein
MAPAVKELRFVQENRFSQSLDFIAGTSIRSRLRLKMSRLDFFRMTVAGPPCRPRRVLVLHEAREGRP